eukprot:TRINITY_DN11675_c0_g1_i1.p1 TRINITY_DN11675_c0_g1~~TRINITY_DN11675_c0_g1_i1.p1  ORF type:complete len:121 (-),score=15.26 TRINITY_DN11675_c0_g1_i1:107-469(-)
MSWFDYSNSNLATSFCQECNSLLSLPKKSGIMNCDICGFSCMSGDVESQEIVTNSRKREEDRGFVVAESEGQMIVDGTVVCEKCGCIKISFYTRQMRSADEGQSVFYTCTKCQWKWRQDA